LLTLNEDQCAIVDYKTGGPDDHHAEQVRLYQLIWSRDRELNPDRLPVTSLTISYAAHDVSVTPLAGSELEALADELATRIHAAEHELALRPPPARPAADLCRLCGVRQLCSDYWTSSAVDDASQFVDREGAIISRNGSRSWMIQVDEPRKERALLRTLTEQPGFDVGDDVRLLDLVIERDEETGEAVLTVTQSSEVFRLSDR
jgi:hypothetical protein